jgi:hypothetical protein
VRQRAFLLCATHEHRDSLTDGLVDVNYKDLFIVPDEDCAPASSRDYGPDLDFNDGFAHWAKLLVMVGPRQRAEVMESVESHKDKKINACRTRDQMSGFALRLGYQPLGLYKRNL